MEDILLEKALLVKKQEAKERETKTVWVHNALLTAYAICAFFTPWPRFHDFGLTIPNLLLLFLGLFTKRHQFILGYGIFNFVRTMLNLVPATYLLLTGKPTLYRLLGVLPMDTIPTGAPFLLLLQWYVSITIFLSTYRTRRSVARIFDNKKA
jgi:hypothetical protein